MHRVLVQFGDVDRTFESPLIAIDDSSHIVHVWPDQRSPLPAISALLQATLIEWVQPKLPPRRDIEIELLG